MTIFLMVLKKLIKDQLNALSVNLDNQSKSYRYNRDLSKDQKEIIDGLDNVIVKFQGSDKDRDDVTEIIKLIDDSLKKIQDKREAYGEPRDKGNTVTTLNTLRNHVSGFDDKLFKFSFNLLDKIYTETPENIVYYHAAYYLGDEIFNPKGGDLSIRSTKEQKLGERLETLKELIKPHYNLEEQRRRVLQVLKDLSTDNQAAIKKDKSSGYALPWLTLYGAQLNLPEEWFAASEGRFAEEFNMAVRKINAMTAEQFVQPELSETPISTL